MKEAPRGFHFSQHPERYRPISCPVCKKCWFDIKTNACVYGGPFNGYEDFRT